MAYSKPAGLPQGLAGVRGIYVPGGSIFDLRAKGTEAARGALVGWTEDHCRPSLDWCERMMEAHAAHPEAAIIGGSVVNGSTTKMMDWSNFLCTFGPFVPPLNGSHIPRVPVAANLSFKRSAIPAGKLDAGFLELVLEARVWSERKVRFDDRIVVKHLQSMGRLGTPAAHFHNGRSTTGLVVARMRASQRLFRMLVCLALPAEILRTAVPPLVRKPGIPVLRCLPFMTMLALAHSAGEFIGLLLKGAGNSPIYLD